MSKNGKLVKNKLVNSKLVKVLATATVFTFAQSLYSVPTNIGFLNFGASQCSALGPVERTDNIYPQDTDAVKINAKDDNKKTVNVVTVETDKDGYGKVEIGTQKADAAIGTTPANTTGKGNGTVTIDSANNGKVTIGTNGNGELKAGSVNTATVTSGVSNADVSNSRISNSGVSNSGVSNSVVSNAVVANAGVSNSGVSNSGISNSGVSNSIVSNSVESNSVVANAGVSNSGVSNSGVSNSGVSNSVVANAGVSNSGVSNSGISNSGVSNSVVANAGVSNSIVSNSTQLNAKNADISTANIGTANIKEANVSGSLTVGGEVTVGDQIHGVQNGTAATDAVNKRQLDQEASERQAADEKLGQRINGFDTRISGLSDRIDKVGAMSAALSALSPIGYDPKAPTQISAGVGTYKGNQAFAIGVFHYANKNLMWNLAWANSSGENAGRLGATWKIGKGSEPEKLTNTPAVIKTTAPEIKEVTPAPAPAPTPTPAPEPADHTPIPANG